MKNITIIGSGNMGSALARHLSAAGHKVVFGSRAETKAADRVPGVPALPVGEAVGSAEIVFLAVPYGEVAVLAPRLAGLAGKVVVDLTNPLTADYMGLTLGFTTSAAEQIQRLFPDAKVVKGFNTIFAQLLAAGPALPHGEKVPVFLASDHADAKTIVSALAAAIGFSVVDAGKLVNARYLEPLAGLNIYLGYGAGLGTAITPAWLKASVA